MNGPSHNEYDRLEELLIERATIGLTTAQASELEILMRSLGVERDDSYDLTAAAIDAAVASEQSELLPDRLRQSAIDSAQNFFGHAASIDTEAQHDDSVELGSPNRKEQTLESLGRRANSFSRRDLFATIAVAASLLVATFVWFGRPDTRPVSVAQRYQQFLNQPPNDLVRIDWSPSGQPVGENVTGKVSWSDEGQTGFMTFSGLPKNDPGVEQYQLWIFDKDRDEKYPVDGGVFDISGSSEETIVAINAKINVTQATLFAITIEQPGGVVVSDRKRLPVVASVE